MKRWALVAVLGVCLLCLGQSAWGVSDVAPIFDFGVGARPLGMGGAFLALADDENAVVSNPAGLGFLRRLSIYSAFVSGFAGETCATVGLALPWLGVAVVEVDSGLIPSVTGEFRFTSQAGVISFGLAIGGLGLGGRLKLLRVSEPFGARGLAFDPAILWVSPALRVGMLLENAISRAIVQDDGAIEEWPLAIRIGAALTVRPIAGASWNLAIEEGGLLTSQAQFRVGTEIWVEGLAARAGYDGSSASVGLSATLEGFRLDWAYYLSADLGDSHRVSVTFQF
jgi:hypothetical protein